MHVPIRYILFLEKKNNFRYYTRSNREGDDEYLGRHLSQTYIIKWAGSSETAPRWLCPKKKTKKLLAFCWLCWLFWRLLSSHIIHTFDYLYSTYLPVPTTASKHPYQVASHNSLSQLARTAKNHTNRKIGKIGKIANVLDRRFSLS